MIVSHSNKFIWVKTRKAASSSIELALNKLCNLIDYYNHLHEHEEIQNQISLNKNKELRNWKIYPHHKLKELQSICYKNSILNSRQWNKYFKFTIERNPWDKVVSLYYFNIYKNNFKSFEEFIQHGKWVRCYNWPLYTHNDHVIVDYVMMYENLEQEIRYISNVLGKPLDIFNENTHQRPKDKKDYREFYNEENKQIIYNYFFKEIQHFNYRF